MPLSPNLRGALLMTGSMTAFTVNDAFMKVLSEAFPFFQLLLLRSVLTTSFIALLAWQAGAFRVQISRSNWQLMLIRTLAEIGAAYFFLNALFNMPIANVTAIIQALPLTVTLGAAIVLNEPVGWRRFAAIAIGFLGVMMIVRPGGEGFSLYSTFALLAVLCVTIRDLAARRLSVEVPSLFVALTAAIGVTIFSFSGAMFVEWEAMGGRDLALLGCAALAIIGGYLFSVMAMRVGEIGFVAPFRYSSLVAALIIGFLVFNEWPDGWTQIGAAIVVATGLFTLWRGRRQARKPTPAFRQR